MHTAGCDRVAGEQGVVLLDGLAHIGNEVADCLLEVRHNVFGQTSNNAVGWHQTATCVLFKDVHNLFTVAHTIDEGGNCTHIHSHTARSAYLSLDKAGK